jgi:hypothetical protein
MKSRSRDYFGDENVLNRKGTLFTYNNFVWFTLLALLEKPHSIPSLVQLLHIGRSRPHFIFLMRQWSHAGSCVEGVAGGAEAEAGEVELGEEAFSNGRVSNHDLEKGNPSLEQ